MPERPLLIAIAGPSCSGKSSLADALAHALPGGPHAVLPLDAYYRDLGHLPLAERPHANFDAPEALDWPLLREHVLQAADGETIAVPVYDFVRHQRTGDVAMLLPTARILIEGLYALYDPLIRTECSLALYMDVSEEICLQRRIARDAIERGRTEVSVRRQFAETVAPMYRRHVAPTRQHADIVLDGVCPLDGLTDEVMQALRSRRLIPDYPATT